MCPALGGCAQAARLVQTEEDPIETLNEGFPVAGPQRLDERAPDALCCGRGRFLATGKEGEIAVKRLAARRIGLEKHGAAQRPGLAEQRRKGAAQLLRAERLVLEEGKLPAVERLGEIRVGIRLREQQPQLGRQWPAEVVESRRLAGRL